MTNIGAPVHWPVQQFRVPWIPGQHRGIDYGWRAAPNTARSKENLAAAAGRVDSVADSGAWNQGWGNRIWVQHTNRAATTYSQSRTGSARVRRGDVVSRGQVLSIMGQTGQGSGDHLHFEVYIDGHRVDPQPYLDGLALPGTPVVTPPDPGITKGTDVFIAIRNGAWYLITPAENGRLHAGVLGGQDNLNGLPSVEYVWDNSWAQLRSRLVNPGNVPA